MTLTTKEAMAFLKEHGYCVANLWHIDDVKVNFECTDEQAHSILSDVLNNEYIVAQTFEAINDTALLMGLKERDDD